MKALKVRRTSLKWMGLLALLAATSLLSSCLFPPPGLPGPRGPKDLLLGPLPAPGHPGPLPGPLPHPPHP